MIKQVAKRILIEMHNRLDTLMKVGLGYLNPEPAWPIH